MDPVGGDRVISVEIFHILSYSLHAPPSFMSTVSTLWYLNARVVAPLREFEQLATVPLGQTMQLHASPTGNNNTQIKQPTATSTRSKTSFLRGSSAPRSRLGTRPSSASRDPSSDVDGTRARAPKIKPADRSQVQEELRSVLEGTIELTKVLQEQLHELKLKGWNVTPRS